MGDDGVLRIKLLRDPDVALIRHALIEIEAYGKTPLRILDCRGITLDLDMGEQDEISAAIRQNPMYGRRTAILVDNPLSFARVRQFMAYREDEVIERQVFKDEADALYWLLNPAEDDDSDPATGE